MRKITIVGAGHSGLQLGIGLLGHGYEVTVLSNRTPEQIAAGRVLSSQSMYDLALTHERELGLAFWDDTAPGIEGAHIAIGNAEAGVMLGFSARMSKPGQSIDQRLKMPRWIEAFRARGGRFVVCDAGIDDLERCAQESDLVIVAAGKGEIGKLFERDAERSVFDRPQRTIALTYVHGMVPRTDYTGLNINLNPGIGELVHFPGLTLSGACDIINLECIPGGPMDRWDAVSTPAEHLAMTQALIREFFPWEAPRFEHIRLTDDNGILAGRVTPTVRKGVGTLPSGAPVLGIADVMLLNDPTTGQGSNNASKGATLYLAEIIARGGPRRLAVRPGLDAGAHRAQLGRCAMVHALHQRDAAAAAAARHGVPRSLHGDAGARASFRGFVQRSAFAGIVVLRARPDAGCHCRGSSLRPQA